MGKRQNFDGCSGKGRNWLCLLLNLLTNVQNFAYSETVRRVCAYHEAGHAIVSIFTEGSKPVYKATIIPRREIGALGLVCVVFDALCWRYPWEPQVQQLPESDDPNWSKEQLLADMDVCMGGRVGELLQFGSVTAGMNNWLVVAGGLWCKQELQVILRGPHRLLRKWYGLGRVRVRCACFIPRRLQVTSMGMSPVLGPIHIDMVPDGSARRCGRVTFLLLRRLAGLSYELKWKWKYSGCYRSHC